VSDAHDLDHVSVMVDSINHPLIAVSYSEKTRIPAKRLSAIRARVVGERLDDALHFLLNSGIEALEAPRGVAG
jgi:hypothetical protein